MPKPFMRDDLWLFAIVLGKLALNVAFFDQYGYFRDELYYLACADHLAWGYVDHPPLSIGILALTRALLSDSLFAIRLPAALAAAVPAGRLPVGAARDRRLGLVRSPPRRSAVAGVGLALPVVFLRLVTPGAKAYYLSPIYFPYLAAGAVGLKGLPARSWRPRLRPVSAIAMIFY